LPSQESIVRFPAPVGDLCASGFRQQATI